MSSRLATIAARPVIAASGPSAPGRALLRVTDENDDQAPMMPTRPAATAAGPGDAASSNGAGPKPKRLVKPEIVRAIGSTAAAIFCTVSSGSPGAPSRRGRGAGVGGGG